MNHIQLFPSCIIFCFSYKSSKSSMMIVRSGPYVYHLSRRGQITMLRGLRHLMIGEAYLSKGKIRWCLQYEREWWSEKTMNMPRSSDFVHIHNTFTSTPKLHHQHNYSFYNQMHTLNWSLIGLTSVSKYLTSKPLVWLGLFPIMMLCNHRILGGFTYH